MFFQADVFEKLLFPLNKKVYEKIEEEISNIAVKDPSAIGFIKEMTSLEFAAGYGEELEFSKDYGSIAAYDIHVEFSPATDTKISTIYKSDNPNVTVESRRFKNRDPKADNQTSSDIIVSFWNHNVRHSYIVPMGFVLGINRDKVMRPDRYQVYTHILYPDFNASHGYTYIGITKRTWQKRYSEHAHAAINGSMLLFHRYLRGEFFKIRAAEHIVYRAGLTEAEAMNIEENNVELQSLYPLHPQGLNMIPGGYAGLKFIHNFARRLGYDINEKVDADKIEAVLRELQDFNLRKIKDGNSGNHKNEALAELWKTDIKYRISVMTGQENHFSLPQIQTARILSASGWENDKILENIRKLDKRKITINQVENLVAGKTYTSIPDVLLNI